jgi:hypothetical protein
MLNRPAVSVQVPDVTSMPDTSVDSGHNLMLNMAATIPLDLPTASMPEVTADRARGPQPS